MSRPAENPSPVAFARSVIRTDGRLLILSVCSRCEKGTLVSRADGTLDKWENSHRCNQSGIALVRDQATK